MPPTASAATAAARLSFWSRAKTIPVKYPMAFGIVLSGFKTSFSDLLVQKVVEKRDTIDWRRNAAFASFGFVYLGAVQYTLYVPVFSRLFPQAAAFAAKPIAAKLKDARGMMQLFAQTFIDQCVHHPLMYFPAFYCTKEIVMADKPDIMRVLMDYRANLKEDLAALWKIWVPATLFNFAFMPMHLRIPFVAGVSLLWTCVLSAMRGGHVEEGESLAGGAVTGSTYMILQEGLDENFNDTPVELDDALCHINISAAGRQRPGLVATLTKQVAAAGGNVTYSNMVRLGQEFVMQLHVSVPPEKQKELLAGLDKIKELNLQVTELHGRDYDTDEHHRAVVGITLYCVGEDRPGMLAAISQKVADQNMSIEDVSTELRMRKNGHREFIVKASVSSHFDDHKENVDDVVKNLQTLKEELQLTKFAVRVHVHPTPEEHS